MEKKRNKLIIINLTLSDNMINHIDELVKKGRYVTRSELVRQAVRQFLKKYGYDF